MLTCGQCKTITRDDSANFCASCGAVFLKEEEVPCVGVPASRGVYRITFPAQEEEFDHEDSAWEAVRHSSWNGDHSFEGDATVEFIRSVVGPGTHPYECVTCKAKGKVHETVSVTDQGRCTDCGNVNWQRRSA